MLIDRAAIAERIPHAGTMCLLDGVLEWDRSSIRCVAQSHRDGANPLRSNGQLAAVCGLEYAAQAMALHGGLATTTPGRARSGYLASVRDCTIHTARLDTVSGALLIEARQVFDDGQRVIYEFSLQGDGVLLLAGRAAVVLDAAAVTP